MKMPPLVRFLLAAAGGAGVLVLLGLLYAQAGGT
jgi:hypothetical protein